MTVVLTEIPIVNYQLFDFPMGPFLIEKIHKSENVKLTNIGKNGIVSEHESQKVIYVVN